jgi:hypothetical protein
MRTHLFKFSRSMFRSIPFIAVFALCQLFTVTHAQMKSAESSGSVTAAQEKQLNHLQQLNEQVQKDRDEVASAVAKHGWDSDEADAAQQRLFQDRQEYRALRRSLQQAGVSIPPDPTTGDRSSQSGHCAHHANGHHGCCGGHGHCAEHDGDCCCGNHGG